MSDEPRPKRFPRLILIAIVLIIILVSALAWNLRTPANDPRVQAIRNQGYPVTLTELDEWYRKVPDKENAALIYTNAFARIVLASNAFSRIEGWEMPLRGQTIEQEVKDEFTAIFATNRETLRLFSTAAVLTNSRYPIDLSQGFNVPLPHLIEVRHAMIILGTEGMLHAANGNTELSTQSFLAAGRLTASISQEPLLISQLIDCSDWGVICRRLEWSLNTATFSEEQLARLQEMFAAAENNSFYCGLVGEQAFGYAVFSDPKSQMALLVPGGPFGLGGPPPSGKDHLRGQLLLGFLKTTGFFKKDRAFYLRAMSNHIASSKLPFPERFTVSQNSSFVPPNGFYLISSMMLPALGKAATRDATRAANLRVTETALAIERYRRSNSNSLPDSLSQLVPAYLPAVPADPFDGKPLRFKKRSEGYVVYSVGSDQQDDGGTERDPKKTNVRSDVTFILEH